MIKFQHKVLSLAGWIARPSAIITETTNKFKSEIIFRVIKRNPYYHDENDNYNNSNNNGTNAKSILNLLMLVLAPNEIVEITIDGEDEKEAYIELKKAMEEADDLLDENGRYLH